jgi:hypothetical protein
MSDPIATGGAMSDLELRLASLADLIEYPPTPDIAPRVRARIPASGAAPRRALPWGPAPRRALRWTVAPRVAVAAALAAVVVGLGLTMAVSPSARSAILRWLGIQGVTITRVQKLPPTRAGLELGLGHRVSEAEARRRAAFRIEVPTALGAPDEWHFERSIPGGAVSLVYRRAPGRPRAGPSGVSILLTEFRGEFGEFVDKMLGPGTKIRDVTLFNRLGYLITGTLHAVIFQTAKGDIREDRPRLATNTLLFSPRDGVTFRLEGDLGAERLLAIAKSVR